MKVRVKNKTRKPIQLQLVGGAREFSILDGDGNTKGTVYSEMTLDTFNLGAFREIIVEQDLLTEMVYKLKKDLQVDILPYNGD